MSIPASSSPPISEDNNESDRLRKTKIDIALVHTQSANMTPSLQSNNLRDPVDFALSVDDNVPPPRCSRKSASVASSVAFGIPGGRVSIAGRSLTADIDSAAIQVSKQATYDSSKNEVITKRRTSSVAPKRTNKRDTNSLTPVRVQQHDKSLPSLPEEHQALAEHKELHHLKPSDSGSGGGSIGGQSSGA